MFKIFDIASVIMIRFVSGSLYTDENLYHEDKADGQYFQTVQQFRVESLSTG